ncbi:MAG: DNA polymerase III subunit alpha [Candidatus Paracaedibacteraceae bacterium]|nr:DNA polymerase III subunit alpha [Candidatus Paracaedibacteraceae bacterium]
MTSTSSSLVSNSAVYDGFVHLRVHSAYSLTEGAILMKSLPKLCQKHNMPAMALTDTNNMFGALEFSMAATDAGIQPIIGCQLTIDLSTLFPKVTTTPSPMVFLAQNEAGYMSLMKLISRAYFKEQGLIGPHVTMAELADCTDGVICLTGAHEGPLAQLLLLPNTEHRAECSDIFVKTLLELFPNRLYIELQRHGIPVQQQLETQFLDTALRFNIPIVATNNVFFDTPDMHQAHDALLCVAAGAYVEQDQRRMETPRHYFRSSAEMKEVFADLPEAIENTVNIARRCHYRPLPRKPILPNFPTESGRTENEEMWDQSHAGLEKRLIEEVFNRFPEEQHEALRTQYTERLRYELGIIDTMGFPGYFLIVSDFIKWAKDKGIPVGPGRGSGAGSLVAWVLLITDMDPLRFNLLFERFLNPERVSMPDFDVDFCQDRRDEVIRYVCEKYGMDRVAHIITFGKLQARIVIRDVGRVLQMPYGQIDRICKMIPNNPANPMTLAQSIEHEPLLKQQRDDDEMVARLMDIGMKLEGLYRHASTHAAGVVIGDRPLDELVPLYRDEKSDLAVTQFNMKYVETAGLVKFDFLGLKTLTVVEYCCRLVRAETGTDFRIQTIPLDDPATFALLCRVEAVGIFQLESAGMRDVLRRLQPDRFEDLIALVALYRPGPMDDIPRYLACKHGEEAISYLHPLLKDILEPTYGVMVYQEQVMQIAQVLGGYTLGAADLLRRAMGKKIKSEMDAQRTLFTEGAIKNGIKKEIASQIFDQMAKFAGYGFNKSHSAPYALLAYQTAYLKANYPLQFFAATMTLDMHNTDKLNVYRQDLDRQEIPLLPPNVNESDVTFKVENGGIRYGLAAIKGVGAQAMESLVAERTKNGPFKSLGDFAARIDAGAVNKRQLENMVTSGTFDCMQSNRRQLVEGLEALLGIAQQIRTQKASKQKMLFGGGTNEVAQEVPLPDVMEWTPLDRLQQEFDALGFYLSAHPLDMYKEALDKLGVVKSCNLLERATNSNQTVALAGIILTKQERTSKKGDRFAFVTMTDLTGVYEVAFFSETFTTVRDKLIPGQAVYVTGNLRADGDESYRLTGNGLEPLDNKAKVESFELLIDPKKANVAYLAEIISGLKRGRTIIQFLIPVDEIGTIKVTLKDGYDVTPNQKAALLQVCG